MKKLALLAIAATAVAAQAQVTTSPSFTTFPFWQEDFDSVTAGTYNNLPVFGTPAVMSRIGTGGSLVVRPWPGLNTPPHMIYGDLVNARITTSIPMMRFSGWFHSGIGGVFSSMMTLRFFDVSGNPIGSVTVPLTTTPQFYAWQTSPKWRRVEIYGNIPLFPGFVGIDSLSIRPW
jgi:hypothetical protein